MANFSWLQEIRNVADERERLRRAREALLEVQDAGLSHPYFDSEKASHKAWSEDVLALREIVVELGPRYDLPQPKNKGYVDFEPDPNLAERLGAPSWVIRPKLV